METSIAEFTISFLQLYRKNECQFRHTESQKLLYVWYNKNVEIYQNKGEDSWNL